LIQAKVSKAKNILDLHSGLNPTPQKLPSLRARPCTGMLNRREVLSPSVTSAEIFRYSCTKAFLKIASTSLG
jgi:hypothetical protein